MSDEPFANETGLSAIEAVLGSLAPAGGRIDRDAILFRAGQAAARASSSRGPRVWRAIAASLALVAMGEGAWLANRPPTTVIERVVVLRVPTLSPEPVKPIPEPSAVVREPVRVREGESLAMEPSAYSRMTRQVLRYGLDGLPESPLGVGLISRAGPVTSGQMLQTELRRLREPGDSL